jgi:RNA polymerase sigma factor (sigma-70 family)
MTQSAADQPMQVPALVAFTSSDRGYADLFADHHRSIYRLAFVLCGDGDMAEEITAEVFARVLPKWRRGGITDPVFYLRRAVINEVRSRHRRRANQQRALARHAVRQDASQEGPAAFGLSGPLVAALQQLSVRHRTVVVLRFHDDLSEADVARLLGSPIGTIKAQTSRALAALRTLLEEQS